MTSAADSSEVTVSTFSKKDVSNIFSIFSDLLPSSKSNESAFSCKSCDFQSKSPAELLNHLKSHSRVGPYTCPTCSKSYKLKSNLKTHEKLHTIQRLKEMLVVKVGKRV